MWQAHDMGSGWWLVMLLLMVILVALVIWAVVNRAPDAHSDANAGHLSRPASALEILDRRLAAGEITIEDYEQRRRALARDREHA
jgi:uncharacterized membrane protein